MSETVVMPHMEGVVRDFVAQVRAQLADLPFEDVDELTSGMEADLSERLAELPEGVDPRAALGSPQSYAAELRAAAGLPDAVPAPAPPRPNLLRRGEQSLRDWHTSLAGRYPWLSELQPAWWVVRGGILAAGVALGPLEASAGVAVLMGLIGGVASFAWSRRAKADVGSSRNRIILLANALAVVIAIPTMAYLPQPRIQYVESGPGEVSMGPGVWVNGEAATNLYAYDAAGNRLDNVRLFNQYGQAVTLNGDAFYNGGLDELPPTDDNGSLLVQLGVFPVRWAERTGWEVSTGGWEPPVKITELLRVPTSDAAATMTAEPTATASVTATVSATATASVTTSSAPTVTATKAPR